MVRTFSVVDARNGFWYVVVVEKSSNLTTFSRPQGKSQRAEGVLLAYHLAQGLMEEALKGFYAFQPIHDDILIYGCGDNSKET